MPERKVGQNSHYFNEIGVAGTEVTGKIHVGDVVHVAGHTSDFTQTVDSIEIDHEHVDEAGAGDSIGVKFVDRARVHDEVFVVDD